MMSGILQGINLKVTSGSASLVLNLRVLLVVLLLLLMSLIQVLNLTKMVEIMLGALLPSASLSYNSAM